jgi:hypothetical protein
MLDILGRMNRVKRTASGWRSFNAICCEHTEGKPDRRGRGGVIEHDTGWTYHCFNCGFKTTYTPGRTFSYNLKRLLTWAGYSDEEIKREQLESLKLRDIQDIIAQERRSRPLPEFEEQSLPELAVEIDPVDPDHAPYRLYCESRGIDIDDIWITPEAQGREAFRIIVPFRYRGHIVGHTSRYLDDRRPKYISNQQPGYVFNLDVVRTEDQVIVVCEGIFDALSIGGVALMHNDLNEDQIAILKSLDKDIIIIPDQDSAGLKLAERAAEQGFTVSMPLWDTSIKDVNDAVCRHGRLATLVSILRSRERSRLKIELRRREIEKRISSN